MKTALLALALAVSANAAEPVKLTLADFTTFKGEAPAGKWSEADGVIHLPEQGDEKNSVFLITKKTYSSFELEWEWKVAEGGNNGIKYWVAPIGAKKEWLGIEYQMIDDARHPDANKKDNHSTACIYDIKGAAKDKPVKPAGEWNSSKLVVKGTKIEHWLNGKLVCEADTASDEWKAGIAASKFKGKEGFAPGKGHIMLTDHSDETWFRNIRISE
jgi:hypothetical protein